MVVLVHPAAHARRRALLVVLTSLDDPRYFSGQFAANVDLICRQHLFW